MKTTLIILAFSIIGCSNAFVAYDNPDVDLEFEPYVEKYLYEKKRLTGISEMRNIDILFRSSGNSYAGVCWEYQGRKWIEIDPTYWFNATDTQKYILIFHELGHCDLGREHQQPSSIMEPILIRSNLFTNNESYFLNEFFGLEAVKVMQLVYQNELNIGKSGGCGNMH